MSYDLYFKLSGKKDRPEREALIEYFAGRQHFNTSETQAIYENQATGVYFAFDIGDAPEENAECTAVSFNLNYFRPHIFGLEAEPEVKAFVQHFDLSVFDPQTAGMGEGEYSTEGFLRGWNAGNEFAYSAVLQREPNKKYITLPTAQIESCWQWNLARDRLQEKFGESVFVPRFIFTMRGTEVVRTVVWPDGIPIAIPKADAVLIMRKTILPKRFFRSIEDKALASWEELEDIIAAFPLEQGALPYHLLNYTAAPSSVTNRLRQLSPIEEKPKGVAIDQILNAELVEKFRHGSK